MANAYVKISGSWKEINTIYTKVNGTWKEIQLGYVKVGGSWKLIFDPVTPGSLNLTSPGSYNWVVQSYNTLTVQLWGGGGAGEAKSMNIYGSGYKAGLLGGDTLFNNTFIARGGLGGSNRTGGTASGTGPNLTIIQGENGGTGTSTAPRGFGGASPNGGTRAVGTSVAGNAPGGGGSGNYGTAPTGFGGTFTYAGGGGGGGGYLRKIFARGDLTPKSTISVKVGSKGTEGSADGANGRVYLQWN